jgi:hypothetical protein
VEADADAAEAEPDVAAAAEEAESDAEVLTPAPARASPSCEGLSCRLVVLLEAESEGACCRFCLPVVSGFSLLIGLLVVIPKLC